ncbi:MAG TPA: hypothetical protein VGF99_15440, partial [Myxococcota bacterium]
MRIRPAPPRITSSSSSSMTSSLPPSTTPPDTARARADRFEHADNAAVLAVFGSRATTTTAPRVFGDLRGAFAERLPLDVVRQAVRALVDDSAVAAFARSRPDPGMHTEPGAPARLDSAVVAAFWQHGTGDAAAFVDAVAAVLHQAHHGDVVDRAHVVAALGADGARVFDLVAAQARTAALALPTPLSAAALATSLRQNLSQPLRRALAEAALAAETASTSTVTAAITRHRQHVSPLVAALLPHLRTSVAWRKRDSDTAIADAFAAVLHTLPTPLSLADVHARYGDDGVDLVLALQRGGAADVVDVAEFRAIDHAAPRARPSFVDAVRDLVTRTGLELGGLEALPVSTSLARLASAHKGDAPAIAALLQLVRTTDTHSLDRATYSFPESPPNGAPSRGARFLADLASALNDKGGGTPATDEAVFRAALVEVLAGVADARGVVAVDAVVARYGAAAGAWFAVVATGVESGALGPAAAEQSLTHVPSGLSHEALQALGVGLPDVSFAARMPALAAITAKNGGPTALAGFEVVVAQHLFPTTMGLVDALLKNGLAKDKLHLIGKSYSTHERTYAALLGQGIDVDSSSRQDHDFAEDAAVRLAGAARRQLTKLFSGVSDAELADAAARPRFVLFDEGGKLIETLHKEFPRYAKLCIGVEHTDRGMQLLDDLEKAGGQTLLPVVDMARSAAKKRFESPAIGESVVFHTELELQELGAQPLKKEACVVGYGAVGKATADALRRRGYQVFVHDLDPAALARARADGCEVPAGDDVTRRAAALAHGHLVIGCTGRTVITPDEFAALLPDGAVLTNAASGTHELGIHDLGDEQLARRTAPESLRHDGTATTTFRGAPIATGPFLAPGKHRHLVF